MDANDQKTGGTASTGGSPWDETLDVPEENPKIIGTLDQQKDVQPEKEEKPVPFNIPKEIDEQVGQKVPASSVAADDQVLKKTNSNANEIVSPKDEPGLSPRRETPLSAQSPAVALAKKPEPEIKLPLPVAPPVDPSGKAITPVAIEPKAPTEPEPIAPSKAVIPVMKDVKAGPEIAPIHPVDNISEPLKPKGPANEAVPPTLRPKKKGIFSFLRRSKGAPAPSGGMAQSGAVQTNLSAQQNKVDQGVVKLPNTESPRSAKFAKPQISQSAINKIAPKFAKSGKPPFYKKPVFVIVSCIILLLVATTFLTEEGVISVGLENVYGAVGLEGLWGGIPKNPEKALGMAVVNNKNHPNFKVSGSLSLTVNKTIKSDIMSPLVSMVALPIALSDKQISPTTLGVLTQTADNLPIDTSTYYPTSSDSSSTSSSSPSSSTSTDTVSPSVDSATSGSTSSPSTLGDQSQYPGYQSQETTIKQLDFTFSGSSSGDATSLDVTVNKLVGADSKISLINSKNELFVKTGSDIKFDPKADPNKWLLYKMSPLSDSASVATQFFGATPDQNFSIIGSRVANEKVGSVRCYNYQIDKLEVGGMFDSLGIKSEMIQKINGNIWIGVSDHLIHKISLIIIPSVSSSVTRAEINIEFTNYDVENSITVPSLSDKIDVGPDTTSAPATTGGDTGTTTLPPTSSPEQNDSLRKTDLAKIKGGLEAYKLKTGKYPISSSLLHLDVPGNPAESALVPTYIDAIPADPKASEGWYYGYVSDGKTFKLSARFENLNDPQITKSGDIYLHYVYNN